MNNHTAKHFVLQLGSLASLYLSLAFFIVLTFGLINLRFPDGLDSVWQIESAASSIRLGFAMVIVFFPTYLLLTRLVNKNRRKSNDQSYLGLTKWLIYLSLLVGGFVLLGDLVAVIMGFLEGELTTRFILKSLAVFLVTAAAFYYYIRDAKGYWIKNEKQSILFGATVMILVVAALTLAIFSIPSPQIVREMKADTQLVGVMQDAQWRIEDYYRANETLPGTIDEAYSEFDRRPSGIDLAGFEYTIQTETEYSLCATFNHDSNTLQETYRPMPAFEISIARQNYNWDYRAGEWCFERVIDTEFRQ